MKTPRPEPRPADRSRPAPGDEAAPGTPGTGEDICPQCKGSGSRNGTLRIVLTWAVTSSPEAPSPRVSASTSKPSA